MTIRGFFSGPLDFGERRIATLIKKALEKSAKDAEKLLLKPTATWDHKPAFVTTNTGEVAEVTTSDDPYNWQDDGTKAHPIDGNPYLFFQENYKPKTVVGTLDSVYGGKSGAVTRAEHVDHPGNSARNFSQLALDRIEKPFQDSIDDAIIKSDP